jgi:hypothetical protein
MLNELAAELGLAEPPPWLIALPSEARAELLAAIREVRVARRAALQQAIDAAMEHVPRVLRGALRKVLFS